MVQRQRDTVILRLQHLTPVVPSFRALSGRLKLRSDVMISIKILFRTVLGKSIGIAAASLDPRLLERLVTCCLSLASLSLAHAFPRGWGRGLGR